MGVHQNEGGSLPLLRAGRAGWIGLRRRFQRGGWRHPVRSGRAEGGQRQHPALEGSQPPAARKPPETQLRANPGAGPRVPEREPQRLLGTAPAWRLCAGWFPHHARHSARRLNPHDRRRGHARMTPATNREADTSRAPKTGQIDSLATWVGNSLRAQRYYARLVLQSHGERKYVRRRMSTKSPSMGGLRNI